ncbi:hypothetical protein Scep_028270 [Stephania cephalantha]|uniref:Uncharacterized protein n=1 Tax=Stephania cephalantha TaxID=152367 RepID=A0AAP0HHZ2_9MAGN
MEGVLGRVVSGYYSSIPHLIKDICHKSYQYKFERVNSWFPIQGWVDAVVGSAFADE